MSQEKVDKYKEQKPHRKELYAKEEKKEKLEKAVIIGVAVLFVGIFAAGAAMSGYNSYKTKLAARPDYNREELIINDLASILENDE